MKLLVVSAYHKTSPVCSVLIALTAAEPTVSDPSAFTPPAPALFKQSLVLISDPATLLRKPACSRYKGRHLCLNFSALVGSSWNKKEADKQGIWEGSTLLSKDSDENVPSPKVPPPEKSGCESGTVHVPSHQGFEDLVH